jgi:creatinine amidohydrolase/Fe(II)-dependent formamide hydrolase-like protein
MFLNTQIAAQILRIGEMNTQQIHALDLARTVILIPGGILEEHGPYLPSYADGYADDAYTRELAKAIVARPGWTVLVFPQIPLGNDPASTIGRKTVFPGSYPVRMATLRAIYMDLATEIGEQGFRWIFLVHYHGAPNNHKALNQASDYFHDVWRHHGSTVRAETGVLVLRKQGEGTICEATFRGRVLGARWCG